MFIEVLDAHNRAYEIHKSKKAFVEKKMGTLQIANWKNALKRHFAAKPNDSVRAGDEVWRFENGKLIKG
jgi:hypothetical protein